MHKRYYHWRFDPLTETHELWVGDDVAMHVFSSVVDVIAENAKKILLYQVFDARPYLFYQEI